MPKLIVDKNKSIKYRFEMKIKKCHKTKCWIWCGNKDFKGYGNFIKKKAHRVSYEIYKGQIPFKMLVCHHCDNPSCVNPEHLWLGTHKQNSEDRDKKGRFIKNFGENHGRCKISEITVKQIINRILNGEPMAKIARELGLKYSTVANIKNGSSWKHLTSKQ